ncbi:MAG: hypothetical protein FJW34_00040 [Acidobacteria bacterium]|nr:hypothetical protein [Acidobacteriota bacterium]
MKYGQLRFLLTKSAPGIDPDLLEAWMDGRYLEILDRLQWERLHVDGTLLSVAPYETGTVAVTAASTAVTGTGTTWTAAMSGRRFRVTARSEYYTFTRTGNTTGTLDRAYEGDTDTAAGYMIFANVYALPSDCRILETVRSLDPAGELKRFSRGELNACYPARPSTGDPGLWAPCMDDTSDPPKMQVELYPIPDAAKGYLITYVAEKTALSAGTTSASLLPWLRPAALIAGVQADIRDHQEDYAGAQAAEKRFETLVAGMALTDARRRGPTRIKLAPRFTRHWRQGRGQSTGRFVL